VVSGSTVVRALPPGSLDAQLVAVVAGLAEQEPADLPGPVALERTRLLLAVGEQLRALGARALSDVQTRQLYELDATPTTNAWVAAQAIPGVSRQEVALARRLQSVPTTRAELIVGRLSTTAAAAVAAAVGKARVFLDRRDGLIDNLPADAVLHGVCVDGITTLLAEHTGGTPATDPAHTQLRAELEQLLATAPTQVAALEAALVHFAQRCQPGLLPSSLTLLLDALLPAQHEARARRADNEAGLELHRDPTGSGWTLHGQLDTETGELLHTILLAQQAVDPNKPTDTDAYRAAATHPQAEHLAELHPQDWPTPLPRPRNRRQQRHDALRAGLRTLLDTGGLGTRDKANPHIAIVVSLDYLHGIPGTLPARATSGAPWSRTQTRNILCTSTFTRFVLDANQRVIEASHTSRTATALERTILHLQWGGHCAATGCTRGPHSGHRLIPHHAELFATTKTTALNHTVPLCEQDHHYLHDDHQNLRLTDGRTLGPHGWVQQAA